MPASALAARATKQVILLGENEKTILNVKMKPFPLFIRLRKGFTFNRSKHLINFQKTRNTHAV